MLKCSNDMVVGDFDSGDNEFDFDFGVSGFVLF